MVYLIKITLIFTSIVYAQMLFARPVVIISAAMSLKDAYNEIRRNFLLEHRDYQIHMNYASSGSLRQQIEAGAPVDIYACASSFHMDELEKKKIIQENSRVNFASNSLALTTSVDTKLGAQVSIENLSSVKFSKLAIGNPVSVPAGKYAQEALQVSSFWKDVQNKIILGDHVRQVFSYIDRREVDLGIIYFTDYLLYKKRLRLIEEISSSLHSPISYPMALLREDKIKFYAKWKTFLLSEKGQGILQKYGFGTI